MDDSFHLRACFFILLFFFNFHLISGRGNRWEYDGVLVARSDYQSLLSLKHELVDSRGFLKSWTTNGATDPCSAWVGIKCVNGRVIAIQLPWKGLTGRISEKIGNLKSLRRLSLHDNLLAGPVPTSLGLLRNLRGVYLFNNRLSGFVPPTIGNCLFLQTLDISSNHLTGIIPPSLANSTVLYRLNLSFNGLSGPIPVSLSQSYSLTFLDLQNNNLSSSVPDSWSTSLSVNGSYKLRSLGLGNNFLSGNIPVSLSKLTLLEELNLSHNELQGTIPDELSSLSRLSSIDLSRNNLMGEIPISIADSLRNLSSFNVSYNNLSGAVPSALSKKFSSTSFVGNIQLCGYNGSIRCPDNSSSSNNNGIIAPPQGGTDHHRRNLSTKDIILMAAGCLLFVLLILCCVLLCFLIRKRAASKGKKGHSSASSGGGGGGAKAVAVDSGGAENGGKLVHFDGPFVFTADDLLCATAETMGKTAYGTAYKATLEESNNTVAVKRLREKIMKVQKEFELEVSVLGKIRHDNILALRAYYLGPKGEKLLVYDYMSNGSLASFLHARGPETSIPWPTRKTIAIGIARGLCFLHSAEQNIVHGNLTSSNILLDQQHNPKIAEVGLSRLATSAAASTHLIATAGTTGYRAPELSKQKNATFSTKAAADVYSLGVIMLELLTGKSPGDTKEDGLDLAQWVASTVKDEWTNLVFDVELVRGATGDDELVDALKLALHCVDPSPSARPEARQVLQKLEEMKPDVATGPVSGDCDSAPVAIV